MILSVLILSGFSCGILNCLEAFDVSFTVCNVSSIELLNLPNYLSDSLNPNQVKSFCACQKEINA